MKIIGLMIGKGDPDQIRIEIERLAMLHIKKDANFIIPNEDLKFEETFKGIEISIRGVDKDTFDGLMVDEKGYVYVLGEYPDKDRLAIVKALLPKGHVSEIELAENIDFEFPRAFGKLVIVSEVKSDAITNRKKFILSVHDPKTGRLTPKICKVHHVGPTVDNGIKVGMYIVVNPLVDTGFTFEGKEYFFISSLSDTFFELPVKE